MAYTINKTNGEVFAIVADGTINTDSSQTLVGENYVGYGEIIGEDLIRLLENGSNIFQPINPLDGQLWYDSTKKIIHVYDGVEFKPLQIGITSSTPPDNPSDGDLWFNPDLEQLFAWNGTDFILIGPDHTVTEGLSGAVVDSITDDNNIDHVVVKLMINNDIVGIVSKDPTFTPLDSVDGFVTVNPGIQLGIGNEYLFEGIARGSYNIVDTSGNIINKVNSNGDTMTGILLLNESPTINSPNLQAATKIYVDGEIADNVSGIDMSSRVAVAGDTMTGRLTLSGDPVSDLHAVTKQFLTSSVADKVDKTGDLMTGFLTLNAEPADDFHAATKKYVDTVAGASGDPLFPAGTGMIFTQATAPTGWTQVTTQNNRMIRVVSGTGGGTGGAHDPTVMDKVPTHSHTGSSSNITDHTHTFSDTSSTQSANHSHNFSGSTNTTGNHTHTYDNIEVGPFSTGQAGDPQDLLRINPVTNNTTSSAGSHTHTVTGSIGNNNANHTHAVSGTTSGSGEHNHNIAVNDNAGELWSPMYYDVIFATKD